MGELELEHRIGKVEMDVRETTSDIKEINKAIARLLEHQTMTTKNVDSIAEDMKVYMQAANSCDVVFQRLANLEKFKEKAESNWSWFVKLIGAMLIASVATVILKGGVV